MGVSEKHIWLEFRSLCLFLFSSSFLYLFLLLTTYWWTFEDETLCPPNDQECSMKSKVAAAAVVTDCIIKLPFTRSCYKRVFGDQCENNYKICKMPALLYFPFGLSHPCTFSNIGSNPFHFRWGKLTNVGILVWFYVSLFARNITRSLRCKSSPESFLNYRFLDDQFLMIISNRCIIYAFETLSFICLLHRINTLTTALGAA